jgi:hypothetical protein
MTTWPAPIGAGGYVTYVNFANDGWKMAGGDQWGCWIRGPNAPTWTLLLTSNLLPAGEFGPARPSNPTFTGDNDGSYCGAIAPNDSSRGYFAYNAFLFKVTGLSTSPVITKMAGGPWRMMPGSGAYTARTWQTKISIDPQNKDVFLIGTEEDKVLCCTDGTTITAIAVPANATLPSGSYTPHLVACDPSSPVSGGIKQKWIYTVYGTGIYQSTTGPNGTYSLLTGSPTKPRAVLFDAAGNLWALQDGESSSGNIYKKTPAGSFAKNPITPLTSMECASLAVDPQDTNQISCMDIGGNLIRSNDGGANWLGTWNAGFPVPIGQFRAATSVKWMGGAVVGGVNTSGASSQLIYHPTNGELWQGHGVGIHRSIPPATFVRWNWFEESNDLAMHICMSICEPPGASYPLYGLADRGLMQLRDLHKYTNLIDYPGYATVQPLHGGVGAPTSLTWLEHTYWLDYVPGHPEKVITNTGYNHPSQGWSSNYGDPGTWTRFGFHPTQAASSAVYGGAIVAADNSYLLWLPSQNGRPAESFNFGTSWSYLPSTAVNGITGLPTAGEIGFGTSGWDNMHVACSDKTNGDIYVYNYGGSVGATLEGIWKRTRTGEGTGTWAKASGRFGGTFYPAWTHLIHVDGNTGHLLFRGATGTPFNCSPLYYSTNGGATWTAVSGVTNCQAVAVGKPAPGKTYPSVYVYATIGGVKALHRSDDQMTTWVMLAQYPGNSADAVWNMFASPNVYGRLYIGWGGSGGQICDYSCAKSFT